MKKKYFIMFSFLFLVIGCTKPKCPDGYNLDNDICYKILETSANYFTEKYCVIGTLINDRCYIANTNIPVMAHQYPYTYNYYCDYGYNLIGNMCYPIANLPASRTITTCPNGYTKNKSGVGGVEVPNIEVPGVNVKCYKKITTIPK